MANGHTGWDSVRVDDQVWTDTFLGERHIFLSVSHPDRTFLTMSGCKLVANLRDPD